MLLAKFYARPMNDIDVTLTGHPASSDGAVPLADSSQVAHERIGNTVRWLLVQTKMSQRQLADLLECDVSSVNRALILKDSETGRARRRLWRAHEVYQMALFFDVPVETFYGTNVEQVWKERMTAARSEHEALLRSLNEPSE